MERAWGGEGARQWLGRTQCRCNYTQGIGTRYPAIKQMQRVRSAWILTQKKCTTPLLKPQRLHMPMVKPAHFLKEKSISEKTKQPRS